MTEIENKGVVIIQVGDKEHPASDLDMANIIESLEKSNGQGFFVMNGGTYTVYQFDPATHKVFKVVQSLEEVGTLEPKGE